MTLSVGRYHILGWVTYGLTPEVLRASLSASEKTSFFSVTKPIGLDKLIWSGREAPRSLERKEWTLALSSPLASFFKSEMIFDKMSCSVDEGYPRSSQRTAFHNMLRLNMFTYGTRIPEMNSIWLTLDVDMSWPVSFNMRCYPLPSSMQCGVVMCGWSCVGSVKIMEFGG